MPNKQKLAPMVKHKYSEHVINILKAAGIQETVTKGSWCLQEGLSHIISANDQSLQRIILRNGPPNHYYESLCCRHYQDAAPKIKTPTTCFQSLCRIVAGQQLAGPSAQAVWQRLLETTQPALTPKAILDLSQQGGLVESVQKPAGLSGAKARSILNLAELFDTGILSDSFLETAEEQHIREALLQVRGIGPWSCDMFLLFYLERPDILPLGDLGVRKGMAKHFGLRGSGKDGSLCGKRDFDKMQDAATPYAPYRSLLACYMWKVADSKDVNNVVMSSFSDASVSTIVTTKKKRPRRER